MLTKEELIEKEETSGLTESDSQIVNLVNRILLDAYSKGVSDIHFEPGMHEKPFVVRYRIDGICHIAHQIPSIFEAAKHVGILFKSVAIAWCKC